MADALTAARLQYLDNASTALLTASPAISAHLQTVRQSLVTEGDGKNIQPSIHRVCAACGNILISGSSCEPITKRTRQDRLAAARSEVKVQRMRCNRCARVTVVESRRVRRKDEVARERRGGRLEVGSTVESGKDEGIAGVDVPVAEKVVKKRAAERRSQRGKKESLLSMLEKRKKADESAAGGLGLDLMDFIKH